MAGEQHGSPIATVVLGDERANPLLHGDVEADRRLVEKEHARAVEQRAHDFHLHPFSERWVSHRLAYDVCDLEQLDQLVPHGDEVVLGQTVDRPIQLERVEGGQIPLQLAAGAHDERDPAEKIPLSSGWYVAEHARLAAGWIQKAGEHLEGRRLARAVWPQEADDFARFDLE